MSDMGALDHIARDEFQNFRQDVSEHFARLHECDRRIEGKIDRLAQTLGPIADEHAREDATRREARQKRWEVRMLALGAAFGAGFSIVAAAILYLFSLS
ncbi:MAG: hypothetical protein QXJ74_07715 [Nitrososphaera sp.]|uniref:hypothetical protein n=1 Tax=Nitrososphaera sp. TaxID=1971748 RepID=UPI0017D53F1A|nr:hypothetical protein [Nitrososphaera sp.]NWG38085.1 hypothetical protein [Nitrososphaera sp.]